MVVGVVDGLGHHHDTSCGAVLRWDFTVRFGRIVEERRPACGEYLKPFADGVQARRVLIEWWTEFHTGEPAVIPMVGVDQVG